MAPDRTARNQARLILKIRLTLADLIDSFYAPKTGLLITIFHANEVTCNQASS